MQRHGMRRYDKPCRLTPGETVYAVSDGTVKRVTIQRMVGDGNAWTACGDIVTPYRTFLSRAQADIALARAEAEDAHFAARMAAGLVRGAAVDVVLRVRYGSATLADVKDAASAVAKADDALARAEADLAKVPHPTEGWS